MQKTSSISEEYEAFLRRVISVLGAETLAEMSKHQETLLGETLADQPKLRGDHQRNNSWSLGCDDSHSSCRRINQVLRINYGNDNRCTL